MSGGTINGSGTVALALNNAITQVSPSNPAGIAGPVMLGLGVAGANSCRITPVYSGRVKFEICGVVANNVAGNFTNTSMRFTDVAVTAAPAFGVAATGTAIGTIKQITAVAANANLLFRLGALSRD